MKKKIKFTWVDGKTTEKEFKVRDLSYLDALNKYPTRVQEDKRKKKPKYKPDYSSED